MTKLWFVMIDDNITILKINGEAHFSEFFDTMLTHVVSTPKTL